MLSDPNRGGAGLFLLRRRFEMLRRVNALVLLLIISFAGNPGLSGTPGNPQGRSAGPATNGHTSTGGGAPRLARDPKQAIDEEYSSKIKEYTTEPFFLSPLVDYLPASKTVPTPKAVLG